MRTTWTHYWIAIALLLASAPLPAYLGRNDPIPLARPLTELSYQIGDWRGQDERLTPAVLEKLGTEDVLLRRYVNPQGDIVILYVSYFERQQRGEISHSPKNCLPGAGWQPGAAQRVPYPGADGQAPLVNEIVFDKGDQQQLVYYWFQERGRVIASEYTVKLYLIWDAMKHHRTDGALLRVSSSIRGSEAETRERLTNFMRAALPQINELLPKPPKGEQEA